MAISAIVSSSPVQVFVWEQVQNRWRFGLNRTWGSVKQLHQTIETKEDEGETKGMVIITDRGFLPGEGGE